MLTRGRRTQMRYASLYSAGTVHRSPAAASQCVRACVRRRVILRDSRRRNAAEYAKVTEDGELAERQLCVKEHRTSQQHGHLIESERGLGGLERGAPGDVGDFERGIRLYAQQQL